MRDLSKRIENIVTYLSLFLIVLACSLPLLNPEFFRVHDYIHLARIAEMARAVTDGHIIPRWSQNFGYGYGMPLFQFYAPLPYYWGSILLVLGLPEIIILKSLYLVANIFTALGSYLLGKSIFNRSAGLLIAALITLAPYRALNLYVRGAVSEIWGLMFLPWIFYGLWRIKYNQPLGFLVSMISMTGLLLSHNLTSLISIPNIALFGILTLALGLIDVKKTNTKPQLIKHLGVMFISLLLAVGLTAFYTVPALAEKNLTQVESSVINEYFDYKLHFVYLKQLISDDWGYGGSTWGRDDDISFLLGYPQLFTLAISLLILIRLTFKVYLKYQQKDLKQQFLMLNLILLGVIFNIYLTTEKSHFIWDKLTFFSYFQFPWRWLSGAVLWLGLLGGVVVSGIKTRRLQWVMTIFLIIITSLTNYKYFQPEKYLSDFSSLYYTNRERIASEMSATLNDFLPTNFSLSLAETDCVVRCLDQPIGLQAADFVSSKIIDKVAYKEYLTSSSKSGRVIMKLADYPGWQVLVDGQNVAHQQSPGGLIAFELSEGSHRVSVVLNSTPTRTIADSVSLISLMVSLLVTLFFANRKYLWNQS